MIGTNAVCNDFVIAQSILEGKRNAASLDDMWQDVGEQVVFRSLESNDSYIATRHFPWIIVGGDFREPDVSIWRFDQKSILPDVLIVVM